MVVQQRPRWWPRFSSTLRSTAVTARFGCVLGIAIAVLFVTGFAQPLPVRTLVMVA
jgi:hypothetical protein